MLIIEVLSKSTRKYDRTEKFQEYKTLPSFKEYILIDPEKYNVEIRYQEETNLWRDTQYKNLEEKIVLKSVGVSIPMEDIYQNVQFK